MTQPKIKDIAVVAIAASNNNPIGEAFGKGESALPMISIERGRMGDRLFNGISNLMDHARVTHLENNKMSNTDEIDPDYITRLSTNEFFFYTQEALTIQEFETLQNKIANKARELPSGIHLALGSFAVKTAENHVMNITPHITCGETSSFNFIIKNATATIDVKYRSEDGGHLKAFDLQAFNKQSLQAPQINVNGVPHSFRFNNVIHCNTPGGTPFLTAMEICLDHKNSVAKSNIEALVKQDSAIASQPISHMVLSNSVDLRESNSFGAVMHVDTIHSHTRCKAGVEQSVGVEVENIFFGHEKVAIYDLNTTMCPRLQETNTYKFKPEAEKLFAMLEKFEAFSHNDINKKKTEFAKITKDNEKKDYLYNIKYTVSSLQKISSIKAFSSFEKLKIGSQDMQMDQCITEMKATFNAETSIEKRQEFLDKITRTVEMLGSEKPLPTAEEIRLADTKEMAQIMQRVSLVKLFASLEKLKFGPEDTQMNQYITEMKAAFSVETTVEKRQEILDKITKTVEVLGSDKNPTTEVRHIVANFRAQAKENFTIGRDRKADRIDTAMGKVPIEDRCNNFLGSMPSREVMMALASHRHLQEKKEVTYLTKGGDIDEKKATSTFKNFRKKFKEITQDPVIPVDKEQDRAVSITLAKLP